MGFLRPLVPRSCVTTIALFAAVRLTAGIALPSLVWLFSWGPAMATALVRASVRPSRLIPLGAGGARTAASAALVVASPRSPTLTLVPALAAAP
jgi:hypothetical protein